MCKFNLYKDKIYKKFISSKNKSYKIFFYIAGLPKFLSETESYYKIFFLLIFQNNYFIKFLISSPSFERLK